MAADPRPAYRDGAKAALSAHRAGTLVGFVVDRDRPLVEATLGTSLSPCRGGAYVQVVRRPPVRSADDLPAVVVTADAVPGDPVLVHEICHFRNRFAVDALARTPAPFVASDVTPRVLAGLVNELAARHTAFLAEEDRGPHTSLPGPGALFACAVIIASYPATYSDDGTMARVVAAGEDRLRDVVGSVLEGLLAFHFFAEKSDLGRRHRAWLADEAALAKLGRRAPRVPAEGTI